jgi:hypothetical protein
MIQTTIILLLQTTMVKYDTGDNEQNLQFHINVLDLSLQY